MAPLPNFTRSYKWSQNSDYDSDSVAHDKKTFMDAYKVSNEKKTFRGDVSSSYLLRNCI